MLKGKKKKNEKARDSLSWEGLWTERTWGSGGKRFQRLLITQGSVSKKRRGTIEGKGNKWGGEAKGVTTFRGEIQVELKVGGQGGERKLQYQSEERVAEKKNLWGG